MPLSYEGGLTEILASRPFQLLELLFCNYGWGIGCKRQAACCKPGFVLVLAFLLLIE